MTFAAVVSSNVQFFAMSSFTHLIEISKDLLKAIRLASKVSSLVKIFLNSTFDTALRIAASRPWSKLTIDTGLFAATSGLDYVAFRELPFFMSKAHFGQFQTICSLMFSCSLAGK